MAISLVPVLLSLLYLDLCVSHFGFEEFNSEQGKSVELRLYIPTEDNFTTGIETVGEVIKLRRRLANLYDNDNDESVYLKVDANNTLPLVQSSLLFGANLSQKIGHGGGYQYHPMCIYHSVSQHVDAFLDLCSGIKGYFEQGQFTSYIQSVTSKTSNRVKHVMMTEQSHETRDDADAILLTEEMFASYGKRRTKRDNLPHRWLELYVVMDFDYAQLECYKKELYCVRHLYRKLRVVLLILKQNLNVYVVMNEYEFWNTEEKNSGLETYKSKN